jgi:hypothetical protein
MNADQNVKMSGHDKEETVEELMAKLAKKGKKIKLIEGE